MPNGCVLYGIIAVVSSDEQQQQDFTGRFFGGAETGRKPTGPKKTRERGREKQ
jgi:hypothetical protein